MKLLLHALIASLVTVLVIACGGGGGGGGNGGGTPVTVQVQFTVNWAERSRAIDGPGSAASVKLEIAGAGVPSGDFSFTVNRNTDPAAHLETYISVPQAKSGSHLVSATFYAGANGTGDIVGVASGQMTVQTNGQLSGTISTVGTIATVEVPAGQTIVTDQTKQLVFTCRDANSTIIAVSPGSALWNVTAGADKLSFSEGFASGLLAGNATVTATVDGKTSAGATVTVQALEHILFTSERDGDMDIYVMRSDGSNQVRLTNNSVQDSAPSWSPDGSKIIFSSERDGNAEVYIMNADGSNQVNLTNNAAWDGTPVISPDGTKIAFSSARDVFNIFEMYVMDIDGSGVVRLTNDMFSDALPVWSPDSTKIAFTKQLNGWNELYCINVDGTGLANLTNSPFSDGSPSFTPDSSKVICESSRPENSHHQEIWLVQTDGTNGVSLTNDVQGSRFPALNSPGTLVLFCRNAGGVNNDIFKMGIDGSGAQNLTNHLSDDRHMSFSPDGAKVVFESDRDGNIELYIMNSDGSNQQRLTTSTGFDFQAKWRP
jgi:Tol biopolymer transport system component